MQYLSVAVGFICCSGQRDCEVTTEDFSEIIRRACTLYQLLNTQQQQAFDAAYEMLLSGRLLQKTPPPSLDYESAALAVIEELVGIVFN